MVGVAGENMLGLGNSVEPGDEEIVQNEVEPAGVQAVQPFGQDRLDVLAERHQVAVLGPAGPHRHHYLGDLRIHDREPGPKHLVPADDLIDGAAQRGRVQRTGQPQGDAHIVTGVRPDPVEHPQAFLTMGQGNSVRTGTYAQRSRPGRGRPRPAGGQVPDDLFAPGPDLGDPSCRQQVGSLDPQPPLLHPQPRAALGQLGQQGRDVELVERGDRSCPGRRGHRHHCLSVLAIG